MSYCLSLYQILTVARIGQAQQPFNHRLNTIHFCKIQGCKFKTQQVLLMHCNQLFQTNKKSWDGSTTRSTLT